MGSFLYIKRECIKTKKKIEHIRKKAIGILIILSFLISFLTPVIDLSGLKARNVNATPKTSTNCLFNGKLYTFNLDDFYDDEDLTKIWTGAKFQTEMFNRTTLEWSGVVNNDTVTPVDNTEIKYGESSGVYNGTYDFRDELGETNLDIDFVDIITGTAEIISEYQGHKKVLNFTHDASNSVINNLPVYQTSGTIEFYLKEVLSRTYFRIQDIGGLLLFEIMSYPTYVKVYYGDGAGGNVYSANYFFTTDFPYFKVSFDCGTDTFSVWCEDFLMVDNVNFKDNEDLTEVYRVRTYNSAGSDFYLDAIGYDWDPDYTIGENLYPDNFNMIKGNYDYTDNMRVNDASYTTFTSTHTDGYIREMPSQWDNFTFTEGTGDTIGEIETIDANYSTLISTEYIVAPNEFITSVNFTKGYIASGTLENTWIDDANSCLMYNDVIESGYYIVDVELLFDNELAGRDFLLSTEINFVLGITMELRINDIMWKSDDIDFDDELVENVNKISIYVNHTSAAYARMYYFKIVEVGGGTPAEIDVQVDIQIDNPDLSSIEYLKYSHKTNVSATIDLDIWNWDTSTWFEIESIDNFATFDDDSFTLGSGSDYVSETGQVRIQFQLNTGSNDFELLIDRLRLDYLTIPAELEMIITFSFANYGEDLLVMNVQSWQRTNISHIINFSIWNFDTSAYVQINSSSDITFTKKEYNTTSPNNFISPTGTVKLYWVGSNTTDDFELHIDYLYVQIYYKLDLVHSKSFDTNGIYRYRWCVLGSIYYTQWVTFEVVNPIPNFHAISESDATTRWILQGSDISPVENFTDDLSGSNWDLYGVSERTMAISEVTWLDAYVSEDWDTFEFGDSEALAVGHATGDDYHTFLKWEYDYLDTNYTSNSTLFVNAYQSSSGPEIDIYTTFDFNELSINWNNQPANGDYLSTYLSVGTGEQTFGLGLPYYYYKLKPDLTSDFTFLTYSSETGQASRRPVITHYLSKNYQGGGLIYMQTNLTESISLKSEDYGTHYTLSSGDYFEVDFQTNSDSQINLILIKDGVVNKTLTLSQSGNPDFNRHTAQVSVDEDVEFDQLKISSIFEDTDNVKVYDIKTKKYTITGDYADFKVGSKNDYLTYLTPDIYNLRISEGTHITDEEWSWDMKINTNITIPATGVRQYVYVPESPIPKIECRLTLFSVGGGLSLTFTDYHIDVNRSYNGVYGEIPLVEPIFYADEFTTVYISVYDRFDLLIGTFPEPIDDYIDLEIEVYSLQIKNLQTQKTTVDINTTHVYPLLSEESIYFMLSKNYYQIGYYDTNDVYKQFLIYLNSNQAYELNRSKICFLAFVNQKGEHLYFNDYKTYINGTLLYENVFYREIGDDIGIEVKDFYGISIKNQTYTVVSGDNYIPVVLTQYSLKVMSQQLCFNHINITRDPNYYESEYYWSEWIAPSEIIEFKLFAGYYKINLTNNEAGSSSYYSYTLSGDDILLIGSNNTIYNVLVNIANVNATIGNQITNVQIDLTNQNSNINNSIINVDINLGNINSTLGNMLVNLDVDITNIANNISNLYTFTENSFINLGNDINVSFISIENNIISINQSISNLVIGVSNDIYLINGTISTMITQLETNLLLMNVSIDTALFDLSSTLNLIGSNITSNFILLNNSIYLNNLNINDSRIAIINNLLLINNTISTLISDVYSAVYLINNSIYTAVVDLGTYLSLMNNTIYGNLSIVLEMNEFLTEIYKMTMFSDLLNWTNIGLNTSLITSQIDAWTFINHYRNQSIEIHLRYQDLIEKLAISADDFRDQYLPNKDVEYNLWSVVDGKYIDEWKDLDPDNKTVNFGFFEEEIPIDPTPIATTYFTLFIALIFFVIMSLGILKLYYSLKERRTPIPPEVLRYMNKKSKKKIDGVVDNRI